MKTKIVQRRWSDWSRMTRQQLFRLTMREDSGMKEIIRCADHYDKIITFVLFESNKPVAWSLASWDEWNGEYDIMLYVRRDRRKLGYGRRLFNRTKKWVRGRGDKFFIYHDGVNNKFWSKVGEPIEE